MLLVHPGGPFWARKDLGSWSIPKGEYEEGEDPLIAAVREFGEETGGQVGRIFYWLSEIVQPNKKIVSARAVEGDFDPKTLKSNLFEVEWPPRSGKTQLFPEVDCRNGSHCRRRAWLDNSRSSTAWSLPFSPLEYCF